MKKYSFRKPNSERERPVISIRMTPETKEWLMKQAETHDTSIGNMIRTAILLLRTIMEKPEKIYDMLNSCLWIDIKSMGEVDTKLCVEATLIDKLVKESERL